MADTIAGTIREWELRRKERRKQQYAPYFKGIQMLIEGEKKKKQDLATYNAINEQIKLWYPDWIPPMTFEEASKIGMNLYQQKVKAYQEAEQLKTEAESLGIPTETITAEGVSEQVPFGELALQIKQKPAELKAVEKEKIIEEKNKFVKDVRAKKYTIDEIWDKGKQLGLTTDYIKQLSTDAIDYTDEKEKEKEEKEKITQAERTRKKTDLKSYLNLLDKDRKVITHNLIEDYLEMVDKNPDLYPNLKKMINDFVQKVDLPPLTDLQAIAQQIKERTGETTTFMLADTEAARRQKIFKAIEGYLDKIYGKQLEPRDYFEGLETEDWWNQ